MKTIGAAYLGSGRCRFTVWAPLKEKVSLLLLHPEEQEVEMHQEDWWYFTVEVTDIKPGARYRFVPGTGKEGFPDPASCYQPEGVHGPSEVVDHSSFEWTDGNWQNIPLSEMVIYELHVGTFTPEGTFEAIIPRLEELKETGVNAIELLPVAQFPGNRNWGYDGVYPYAVQNTYGGPTALKKLVNACHSTGIAVLLDVVYNHLGPEGNYLEKYGPYFTDKYKTPWGKAVNYDGEYSDGVRDYISQNPRFWQEHYHVDGLRLDAIHTIFDQSAISIWELFRQEVGSMDKPFYLIAESDLNSPRVVQQAESGGFGFDAQWLDDFHHALYVLLDRKGQKFYVDFGKIEQLTKAYKEGFVHTGEHVEFRKKTFGTSSRHVKGDCFVAFTQNHDQIGNRINGERMSTLVDFERLKLSAAALLLSPYIPMLFMGEEYGEENPFLYFVSHTDKELIEAVQKGRKEEFSGYKWEGEPPNPQDEKTFEKSKLQWQKRSSGKHQVLLRWYQKLISLRKSEPALQNFDKDNIQAEPLGKESFILKRQSEQQNQKLFCLFNLSEHTLQYQFPDIDSSYKLILSSKDEQWIEEKAEAVTLPEEPERGTSITLPPLSICIYKNKP
ncbi:malto-oligosyltrehalose trehalohydrolase [Pontibacter korlensis]|uniref:Malto-oligosyltrehalose trehalohydrolase n=1 Tax=Pontibacter korlensis TaxID=400092 RepID=A0A0E3ZFV9_9BACT|nr:malto-oligosyltrehalose trehalohydrolase [Pontibacter korlensis]AKD04529.1 malto-oligosyltrehalose trehalohydrolase [Pontibacter korlensis]